jgi:hypothetical protein
MAMVGLLTAGYLVINWPDMSNTHRMAFTATVLIILHLHEEERFPGGFGLAWRRRI